MGTIIIVALFLLPWGSWVIPYWMGVRAERGRQARWREIQKAIVEERKNTGGIVLKKIRVRR